MNAKNQIKRILSALLVFVLLLTFLPVIFIHIPADKFGDKTPFYVVHKMIYTPDATAMGDIMTMKSIAKAEGGYVAGTSSWLRVKQYLNLDNKVYDYSSAYVSNVKRISLFWVTL